MAAQAKLYRVVMDHNLDSAAIHLQVGLSKRWATDLAKIYAGNCARICEVDPQLVAPGQWLVEAPELGVRAAYYVEPEIGFKLDAGIR